MTAQQNGAVYASPETIEFFGEDLLGQLNEIADRDKIVIVSMSDLLNEDGSVPDEDALRTRLQAFMREHGVTLDGRHLDHTVTMLDEENETGFFYKRNPLSDGHAIIAMQPQDMTAEDMFERLAGNWVDVSDVQNIAGDGRDWRVAVLLHEAGHASPEQTQLFNQFFEDFERQYGIDLQDPANKDIDLTDEQQMLVNQFVAQTEILSDRLLVERWAQLHEDGLVSDANVPQSLLTARAIGTMTEETTHITNVTLDADGDNPSISGNDALSGVLLARQRIEEAVEAYRAAFKQDYIDRVSPTVDQTELEAEILTLMIFKGQLELAPEVAEGVLAALAAGDQETIDNLKALPNFHEGLFEDQRLISLINISGEPYDYALNSDVFYQEAKNLYLSGGFEDDIAANTAVYEFLTAARDYAPDAFKASPDDVFPPPDQPIVPDAPVAEENAPQVNAGAPVVRV